MGNTVKVKLIRTHLVARPGETIIAFGHKFIMQPDGNAVCDMHKDFIPTEVAARRVEVIEPGPQRPQEVVPELVDFSMEIQDFYGTGSIEKLTSELSKLRKQLLQEFASTRLSVDIPGEIPNEDIKRQIIDLVKRAHPSFGLSKPEQSDSSSEPATAEEKTVKKTTKT
jgi:hypothetical protein